MTEELAQEILRFWVCGYTIGDIWSCTDATLEEIFQVVDKVETN